MPLSDSANDVFGRANRKVMNISKHAEEADEALKSINYAMHSGSVSSIVGRNRRLLAIQSAIDAATAEKECQIESLGAHNAAQQQAINEKDKRIAELDAHIQFLERGHQWKRIGAQKERIEAMAKLLDFCTHNQLTDPYLEEVYCTDDCPRCAWEKMKEGK